MVWMEKLHSKQLQRALVKMWKEALEEEASNFPTRSIFKEELKQVMETTNSSVIQGRK
jgi:hypothetical protein